MKIIRYMSAALLLALALLAVGCGQKKAAESASQETSAPAKEAQAETEPQSAAQAEAPAEETDAADTYDGIRAAELLEKIKSQADIASLEEVPAQYVMNYFGIDTSAMEDSFFVMSMDPTSAETVIYVRAADEAGAQDAAKKLEYVVEMKAQEMENYLPDQFQLVSASSVKTAGNVAYLIISPQEDVIGPIIEEAL